MAHGLRVFLSYGHDRNQRLAERIRDDLRKAGHDVWFDQDRIPFSADWRRRITDGLLDSDWALALLSRHSARDPGVCLDEIGIALGVKQGALATVLVDAPTDWSIPVSISHLQYLDMRDWQARQEADPQAFEAWYADRLRAILDLLASPATQHFAGEIEELRRRLAPVEQGADIAPLIDGFVGRTWLLEQLEAWRRDPAAPRLFWITGLPGTGKSAFVAWLAHFGRANVIGLNLCAYNRPERSSAVAVIRTLAFQIAARLPDYRRVLLDHLRMLDPKGETPLPESNPATLFDTLLLQRLRSGIDGSRRLDRFVVVIDALDESIRGGRSELAEVLGALADKLPKWIALVVTSRPDGPVVRQLSGLKPHWIAADAAENHADLRVYAQGWLATPGRPAAEAAALVDRVTAAASGNFLYLRTYQDGVARGIFDLNDPKGLPPGLIGLYERWLRHRFPDPAAYRAAQAPWLEVVMAAETPVPITFLAGLFGWNVVQEATELEALGSLLQRRGETVEPFHKSFRDWLLDRDAAGKDFVLDRAAGARRLATALWPRFRAWAAQPATPLDAFTLAELAPRAMEVPDDTFRALVAEDVMSVWNALVAVVEALGAARGRMEGATHAVIALPPTMAGARGLALAWARLAARVGEAAGSTGVALSGWAQVEIGDLERDAGRLDAARGAYRAGLAIRERLAASDPGNAEWQRDLSVSHDRLGDVAVAQGDLDAARSAFRAGLAIAERLAASDPGNAQWQRDLSVSHNKLGDVAMAQGDLDAARAAYRAGLAIRERLAASDPGNAQWQRDLSVSHSKLGNVAVAQGDLDAARSAYRADHAIAERLAAADPGNAQWQRDLSVSHEKLGDVAVAQGDLDAARAAYRAGLAIRERLAVSDRGNAKWQRDLSVSHSKLGDVAVAQGNLDAARAAYRARHAIAERLAAADPGNAEWQRDLSVSHNKLGDVAMAQGDLDAARSAYRAGHAIAERLAASDPGNARWQRDLSISHDRLGDVAVAQGDLDAARAAYRAGLAIRERLAASDPGNAEWQRDLSVSHEKLGDVAMAQGDLDAARAAYRARHAIAERLAASDPGNAEWQRDLSVSHDRLGDVAVAQGDLDAARSAFRAGLAIRERLAASDPGNAEWQRDVIVSCVKIAEVSPAEAAAMLTRALAIARALRDAGRLRPADAWMPDDFERRLAAAGGAA